MTVADKNTLMQNYKRDGGVILKGLLNPDEVAELRNACSEYFARGDSHMGTRDFLAIETLANLPFHHRIVESLRSLLGEDYVTLNQFAASANLHNPRWHRDSDNQGNHEYLYDPEYQIAKCAVYLQDNDPEWGGGLEVIPGSHRPTLLGYRAPMSRSHMKGKVSRIQLSAINVRDRWLHRLWLPITTGDVFLFHANLIHRASQPVPPFQDKNRGGHQNVQFVDPYPPKDKFKFMIDWEVSPQNQYLSVYLDHQASRVEKNKSSKLYVESMDVRYPEGYPGWLVEKIKGDDIQVVNYPDGQN